MIVFIIALLIVGLLVGGIARLLLPGRDPMGLFATAAVGIVGSFVGGFLSDVFVRHASHDTFHPVGLVGSVLGAMVLLLIIRLFRRADRY
jgi:uncharacterized membrane protein YeaQ/YmgE (transglycosylase-associated protein family)